MAQPSKKPFEARSIGIQVSCSLDRFNPAATGDSTLGQGSEANRLRGCSRDVWTVGRVNNRVRETVRGRDAPGDYDTLANLQHARDALANLQHVRLRRLGDEDEEVAGDEVDPNSRRRSTDDRALPRRFK